MPTLTGAERTLLGPQLDDIKKRQFALKKQAKLKYETSPNNNLDYLLDGKNFLFTKILGGKNSKSANPFQNENFEMRANEKIMDTKSAG
jgi:hypothetical protein